MAHKQRYETCIQCQKRHPVGIDSNGWIWVVDDEHQYPFFCSDVCLVKYYWSRIKERRDADKG